MLLVRRRALLLRRKEVYECVGGPLNMKGTGRSVSHEVLLTHTYGDEPMRIHCLQGYISSLYLVQYPEHDRWLLLDCGMPSDVERVQSLITTMRSSDGGVFPLLRAKTSATSRSQNDEGESRSSSAPSASPSGPRMPLANGQLTNNNPHLVVGTHCHVDHYGSARRWAARNVPVAVATHMDGYYKGFGGRLQEVIDCLLALLVAHRLGRRFESPFSSLLRGWPAPRRTTSSASSTSSNVIKILLDDGDTLPEFDDWVAIKCPGHTDHMVLLYHPHTQILYVSDFVVAPRRFRFQAPVPVEIDFAYSHSLHRLRKLPVRFALLAHGGIVDMEDVGGWNAVLDIVVENQKKKSNRVSFRLIDALTGLSPCTKTFTRDMLPRRPLPATTSDAAPLSEDNSGSSSGSDAVPIIYIKNL